MITTNSSLTTTIDLLRHGEPEGGQMYRGGGTDHLLSASGWQQMHDAVNKSDQNWSEIITSPMLRCKNFAMELAETKGIPCTEIENLREAGYGSWEGRRPEEIIKDNENEYWQFFDDPVNCRPAHSESLEIFTPRIEDVLNTLLEDYKAQHILLISHLAVTRAIIGTVLGMPLASQQLIDMPFAGMLRLIKDRKGLRLVL